MSIKPTIYTKTALIEKLQAIAEMGWIQNARHGNQGGIGNTLEDLSHAVLFLTKVLAITSCWCGSLLFVI